MNKNKGFTLIELLVVIAIIGVLASIILGLLNSSKAKGNDAKVVSQLKSMVNQAQLYTGPTPLIPSWNESSTGWDTGGPTIIGVSGGNLFNNSDSPTNSLYRLISSLPAGTYIYYSAENKSPLSGGKWAIAASNSTGAFCVDYTGVGKQVKIGAGVPMIPSNASGSFLRLPAPNYSCN